METRNWRLLMLLTLLFVIATPSRACQCYDWHLQQHFCSSQIAIRAEFLRLYEKNNTLEHSESEMISKGYIIKLKEIYKGGAWPQDEIFAPIRLGTSCVYEHESSKFNTDHLIIGFRYGDYLYVDSCSFIKPWSVLSPKQTLGIQGAYQKACSCKVIPCLSVEPCNTTADECVFQRFRGDFQNQDRNQFCCQNGTGMCQWEIIADNMDTPISPNPSTPKQPVRES